MPKPYIAVTFNPWYDFPVFQKISFLIYQFKRYIQVYMFLI